jgi:LmbE family N-acetylglucosaminyl deacetylase
MHWIFLSPHFDDIALSCGGLVWERTALGDTVSIWTICAGRPPHRLLSAYAQLHHVRWGTGEQAVEERRKEDITSCSLMNASYRHFDIPDCIYRPRQKKIPHYYTSGEAIFGNIHPAEKKNLVRRLTRVFCENFPPDAQLVCPLTLGHHVDHQITRKAAEYAAQALSQPLLYYADYPYVVEHPEQLTAYQQKGWICARFEITESAYQAWFAAIAAHHSQISTFWADEQHLQADIRAYSEAQNGLCLWKPA